MQWAACESLVRGIYESLVGGSSEDASIFATVTWLSTVNTKARCDLMGRSVQGSTLPKDLKDEIVRLSKRFQRVTAVRNFYCHANYKASLSTLKLGAVEGYQLTRDETVLSIIAKPADATLVAQLRTAIDNCVVLNREA